MKLYELLKKITPLPYYIEACDKPLQIVTKKEIIATIEQGVPETPTKQEQMTCEYINHAANVLPGLVVAGRRMANRGPHISMIEALKIEQEFYKSLARAEEVKVEP
jgi:hypothetical protein